MEARRRRMDNPDYRETMITPTYHGYRSDIGFYAHSSMEANFARVLMLSNRKFDVGTVLELRVPEQYKDIFQGDVTNFSVDFSTQDSSGRMVMYELMAHPLEDPEGWAKLQMAREQYPDIAIKTVGVKLYKRLQQKFEQAMDNSDKVSGWEKTGYNLKTHPEVFG